MLEEIADELYRVSQKIDREKLFGIAPVYLFSAKMTQSKMGRRGCYGTDRIICTGI